MNEEAMRDVIGAARTVIALNAAAKWCREHRATDDEIRFDDVVLSARWICTSEFIAAIEASAIVYECRLRDRMDSLSKSIATDRGGS